MTIIQAWVHTSLVCGRKGNYDRSQSRTDLRCETGNQKKIEEVINPMTRIQQEEKGTGL